MTASLTDRPSEVTGDRPADTPATPSSTRRQPRRLTPRLRAHCLVVFAVLLEIALILPFVDHLADSNPTIHFTQHGFIFLGGVLIGIAMREIHGTSRP